MIARLLPWPAVCALYVGFALAGCSNRPKAPPLTAEAVYQDDEIGVRFLAPSGWAMQSRAVLPEGTLAKPVILVAYERAETEQPAQFSLLAADVPAGTHLDQFLTTHRVGAEQWTVATPPQQVTINGAAATRAVLTRHEEKQEVRREATAFRRGERVYVFLVTFAATDPASRDAVRTSIESITWTK